MDGIKNNLPADSQLKINPRQQKLSNPYTPRQEELFISSDDAAEKHEQAFRKGSLIKKITLSAVGIIVLSAIAYAAYFSWKAYSVSKQMNNASPARTTLAQYARAIAAPILPSQQNLLKGEEAGRVNILLLGAAGEHKPGGNLTDTVMVASIDIKNKKLALLSLPRDLYVQIPDTQSYTKINSLYPIGIKQDSGVDFIKKSVEKITGLTLNYYVVLDFDGFKKIIDDIGGVNITSERDIYDARYPGPNYSYETFSLSKGFHTLDGATALKYVRERHNDPEGDFGRAKRQQQMIQAVKNKMFSVKTLLNVVTLNNILNALGESVRTDISFENINRFVSLSKEVDMQNITNVVADAWQKDSLLKVSHVETNSGLMFILVPRVGNYSEVQELALNIFDQTEIKKRQDSIEAENARIGIINASDDNQLASKIQKLLTDKLNINNVRIIQKTSNSIADQTTVLDNSNGSKLFTLDELVKKLPASLDKNTTNNSSDDIIITLGSDLSDIYKYEENTMQDLQNAEDNNLTTQQ